MPARAGTDATPSDRPRRVAFAPPGSSGDEGPRRGHRTGARVPPHRGGGIGHHCGETARRGPSFLPARIPDPRPTTCGRPGLAEPAGPGERRPRQPAVEGLCRPSSARNRRGRRSRTPATGRLAGPFRDTLRAPRNEPGRDGGESSRPARPRKRHAARDFGKKREKFTSRPGQGLRCHLAAECR